MGESDGSSDLKERVKDAYKDLMCPLSGPVKVRQMAVIDLETSTDLEKVYLAGFYDGATYKHFEDRQGDTSEPHYPEEAPGAVSQLLTWLFRTKSYTDHWIYAHNGGSFDFLYLIRWLLAHDQEYSFNAIPLQSSILCLEVTEKQKRGRRKTPLTWTFLDSYRLMNGKLEKLGKALVGEGKTPKQHIGGVIVDEESQQDVERFYAELHRNPQRYTYLHQDCTLLYRCLRTFSGMIYAMGGDIGVTAPSSAMLTYRRLHMPGFIPIHPHFRKCTCV